MACLDLAYTQWSFAAFWGRGTVYHGILDACISIRIPYVIFSSYSFFFFFFFLLPSPLFRLFLS